MFPQLPKSTQLACVTRQQTKHTRFAKAFPIKSARYTSRQVKITKIQSLDDLRYAWVAYKRGWNSIIQPGLDANEFSIYLAQVLDRFNSVYLLHALSINNALIPVGILAILGNGAAQPYIAWFPWASTRNKLETIICMIKEFKHSIKFLFYVNTAERNLFELLRSYKLVKRGCRIPAYYANGTSATLYYTV